MKHQWMTLVLVLALLGLGPNIRVRSAPPPYWTARTSDELIGYIQLANQTPQPDTILIESFPPITTPFEIGVNGIGDAFPKITSPITLIGSGYSYAGVTTLARAGTEQFRFFEIDAGGKLTLIRIQLEGGSALTDKSLIDGRCETIGCGGAIYNGGGMLVIRNSRFEGNTADMGGAISGSGKLLISDSQFYANSSRFAGGVADFGGLGTKITNSTFAENTSGTGGALFMGGPVEIANSSFMKNTAADGGAISLGSAEPFVITSCFFQANVADFNGGALESFGVGGQVTNSVFTENVAITGGAIVSNKPLVVTGSTFFDQRGLLGGAIFQSDTPLTIDQSLFARNQAREGGGLYLMKAQTSVTNSTFSLNQATLHGGAVYMSGFAGMGSTDNDGVILTNVTVFGNSATEGAAIYNDSERLYPTAANLRNSLLVANGPLPSCIGLVEDGGGNLVDGCGWMLTTPHLTLGPLADNGGPTQTHALPADSPAINRGLAEFCPATDQRNRMRDGCDVGAFELTSADKPQ